MPVSAIPPGFIVLHSHRAERLAEVLTGWLQAHPLAPLETEAVLVQSNGMAEWFKIEMAQRAGVCAASRVELPARFMWRTYRQVLGAQHVPPESPLDKLPLTWRLMTLLARCVSEPVFAPLRAYFRSEEPQRCWQLASSLSDVFDQYQMYRPDWLHDWAQGRDVLGRGGAAFGGHVPLPEDQCWQAELWRRVLATLAPHEREATRPALHARVLERLREAMPANPVARRVSVFGMSHMPWQLLELLSALAAHSQVLLAVPNPCQHHWADIIDGREWLAVERRRHAYKKVPLSEVSLDAMHLHAPTLLAAWGRQGRDFIRQLDAFDDQQFTPWPRLDFFEDAPGTDPTRLLVQLQHRIRDLVPSQEPVHAPLTPQDHSVQFVVAHSAVRELEVLHDQLLCWFHEPPGNAPLAPRDVVVMVPDIARLAPAIRAVFGQYKSSDPRHIPFDVADLGAEATSPMLHAVQWLLQLPHQRVRLSELVELLAVPAVAARVGVRAEDLPTLTRWMTGSGIRWGLSAAHREGLGLGLCGEDNSVLFGLQRMLMGYACGADPLPLDGLSIAPYPEVGGLDAELAGALAHFVQVLQDWWSLAQMSASPQEWAERCRTLLASLLLPADESERRMLQALHDALDAWLAACDAAGFEQTVPLAVAAAVWLQALQTPRLEQRFRSGGVTFCTLMPMRAIPFQAVCLLGMNDSDYPRRAQRLGFDLLGLPGVARPGDRARRDDDRQLMLEALMSARQVLYVSWSGRSVRDNSEQPPSVLVSQLREEIDQLWGRGTARRLTTEHPLQPFSRRYFEADAGLHTFAHEWQAVSRTQAHIEQAPDPSTEMLPPLDAAQGVPTLSLGAWASFVRRPVAAFFRQRLGADLREERTQLPDEERFGLSGKDLYGLLEQALQQQPAQLSAESLPAHVHDTLVRLRLAGELPLAGVGRRESERLGDELHTLLEAALSEALAWPETAPDHAIDVRQTQVHLQDSLQGLRWRSAHPLTGAPGQHIARIEQRASRLAQVMVSGQVRPYPEKLIDIWLAQLAANATGLAMWSVVVGRNVVLRSPPMPREQAQSQLQLLLEVWAQGMRWPLPLPPTLAVQYLRKPEAVQALRDLYEGDDFGAPGVAADDPALQRSYPTLNDLLKGGHFERLAPLVFEPLLTWTERLQTQLISTETPVLP